MAPATFKNRKLWLGSLLLLTVLAALWPVPDREPVSSKPASKPASRHQDLTVSFAPLEAAKSGITAIGELFPPQTWTPPATSVVKPAPVAPPLPFTFGGRYTEDNNVTIFLIEGKQMHKVKQGEIINGTYKVEKIEQASISLTYLPLGATQILPTGVLLP